MYVFNNKEYKKNDKFNEKTLNSLMLCSNFHLKEVLFTISIKISLTNNVVSVFVYSKLSLLRMFVT